MKFQMDETEIAWIVQNRRMAQYMAIATAVLMAAYGVIDWLIDPSALALTLPLRAVASASCLFALYPLGTVKRLAWVPAYLAFASIVVTVLLSVIFLGILKQPHMALAGQMQMMMAVIIFAPLRSAIRMLPLALLLSFNWGLWFLGADHSAYVLNNVILIGASIILITVSETAHRTFKNERKLELSVQDQANLFYSALETTSDGFWVVDINGMLLDVNSAYSKQSGYNKAELLSLHIWDLDVQEGPQEITKKIAAIRKAGVASFETMHRKKDGSTWPVDVVISYAPIEGGRFFCFFKDLTERNRVQALTWHQANFDHLTNLPNRALLFDRLSEACARSRRTGDLVGFLFLDLDGFKRVNDKFGHDAGDAVLVEVTRRWRGVVRETDTLARLGGDEFAIVLGGQSDNQGIANICQKIIACAAEEFSLPQGGSIRIGASIGVCIFPTNATDLDELISKADDAMYASKEAGKNTYTFFDPIRPSSFG